ncbi:hypothetical protein C1X64_16655 [Pseudomonas sp. GW456-E7]|nr:hypothetical protein C1X64_16655 [Pseudomonas sp. GW456-E7]
MWQRPGRSAIGVGRETASSFIAGKPAPTGGGGTPVGAGLPAMRPEQAPKTRRTVLVADASTDSIAVANSAGYESAAAVRG